MGAKVDGFVHALTQIARQFDPAFDAATIELRDSRAGNYLGVTLTINATSREQLDELYRTCQRTRWSRWCCSPWPC